jgi:HPt (histidine-containing phosphotransfer) domain-containing protein
MGADMDGAMNRMVDSEDLYATCFSYFMDDPAFAALDAALDAKDYTAAFEAAHSLKGVAGNLGLTRLYELSGQLAEPLRHGQPGNADLSGLYAALAGERDSLKLLVEQ